MILHSEIEKNINAAVSSAIKAKFEFVTIDLFILELVRNGDLSKTLLETCGANTKRLQKELLQVVEQHTPESDSQDPPQVTLGVERLLHRAWAQAMSAGKEEVMPSDIFVALYYEDDSHARYLLEDKEKVSKLKLLEVISHSQISSQMRSSEHVDIETSDSYLLPLNSFVKKNKLEVVNRESDLERLYLILSRKTKNNPLIIAEPGVGKTSFIYSLVDCINKDACPDNLKNTEVFLLDASLLQAGAKFKGEFEERFMGVIKELEMKNNKSILVIDDIHHLINQSSQNSQGNDITAMLKPVFLRGKISVIATTTPKNLKHTFDKNQSLDRYFQKMELLEPSTDTTREILISLQKGLEKHHDIEISKQNIEHVLQLSERYLFDRFFPDKAIDLLDESCALNKLNKPSAKKLSKNSIDKALAKLASIPSQAMEKSEEEQLQNLERNLKLKIYGQNHAIEKVSKAIKAAKAGLQRDSKPLGSFLFSGPTGVGKTDLARQLASLLNLKFQKFDMSEYMEKHSVSRLVGAPPGYVGYEEGGLLTEAIHKAPYSLILLDEIEKAHPDLMNILLQIMDDASLTDTYGKKVNCRNILLIMTTNAGAVDMTKAGLGIVREEVKSFDLDMVKKAFRPEFLNRIDAIIPFQHLSRELLLQVIDKFMAELQILLQNKKIHLKYDEALKNYLLDKGYDPAYGARPFQRIIDEKIKAPLIDEILFGKLKKGGNVYATIKNHKVHFDF
tara:strand:- start:1149 stop:3344 length:2196 start_codon:yes stop_codon:yes gene_type:complete